MCIYVFPGYTVSSVIVGDWRRLYVAGAPRFKHKGKVILFELSNDGDVNIVQALNGEQVKLSLALTSPTSRSVPSICLFIVAGNSRDLFLSEIKARTPPSGSKLKEHVSVRRLDLTMAARCVGWISTRMASLMSFWLQLQCTLAQETRRLVKSTSTPSVG